MPLIRFLLPLLTTLTLWAAQAAAAEPKPISPPIGEQWFIISLNGERTGFSRLQTRETPDGYEITGENSVKIVVLGFSRESSARERYKLNRDLSLKSFSVEQTLDGSSMRISGETTAKGLLLTTETTGARKEKQLKAKGRIYPGLALNLLPMAMANKPGHTMKIQTIDVEAGKIKDVKVEIVGREKLADGQSVLHLRNNLFPMVDNDIWVDDSGRTIKESVRDGLVETLAVPEATAKTFIAEAAVAKQDLILDFSLVRLDAPIRRPSELRRLTLEFSGVHPDFTFPTGAGQSLLRKEGGIVQVTIETGVNTGVETVSPEERRRLLEQTERILPENPAIQAKMREIIGEERDARAIVAKLNRWVAANISEAATDTQSPVETLKTGKGNCQTHAKLFASLARAAGIPTRFVSGLVYAEGKGLLYHSWVESFAGRWIPLDPTFGQLPADATHIKLAEGDSPEEMAVMAGVIGRIKAKIVEQTY